MNAKRRGWQFTVLFSNTARAHERDKTHDWVVVYYEKDGRERVTTAERGTLKGHRRQPGYERNGQWDHERFAVRLFAELYLWRRERSCAVRSGTR